MNKLFSKKQIIKHGIILLVIAIVITHAIPFALSGQVGASSRVISFTFEGIGQGKDPKGNYFDINLIKSDKVLKAAIEKSGLEDKLTTAELRSLIAIVPHVSDKALADLTSFATVGGASSTQDISQKSVHPSQFTIQLKDRGVPSAIRDNKLLTNIINAYTEYLESSYLQDSTETQAYKKEEILALDYPDIVDVLEQQMESLRRFADGLVNSAPKFVDEETGLSFADVREQVNTLQNTDLGSVGGMIKYYQLTRNADERTKYENSALRRTAYLIERRWAKELSLKNLVDMYNNTPNDIYVIGGELSDSGLGSGDDSFYNNLVSQSISRKSETIAAQYEKQEIEQAIATLGNNGLTEQQYAAKIKEAEADLEAAYDKLEALRGQIQTLAKANYDQNIASKIYSNRTSYDLNGGNLLVNLVILIALYVIFMKGRETDGVKQAVQWLGARKNDVKDIIAMSKQVKESENTSK